MSKFTWIIEYQSNDGNKGRCEKKEETGSESRVRTWFASQYKNCRIISMRLK